MTALLTPMVFLNTSSLAKPNKNAELTPATKEDIFLYRGIGGTYFCNARAAGVEFPKAVGIAAATYAQVLNGRHGGFVASAGKKKLTDKQLFNGAEFQVITAAMQFCEQHVPKDVKKKVEKTIKKNNKKKR